MVIPQLAVPKVFTGVTRASAVALSNFCPKAKLIGIKMPQPMMAIAKKIFRHIMRMRKNIAASKPMRATRSCSFVFNIGETHENMPLPNGGGACLSSAILSFGAYTMELKGLRAENPIARRRVKPIDVPKLAYTEFCASCCQSDNQSDTSTCRFLPGIERGS